MRIPVGPVFSIVVDPPTRAGVRRVIRTRRVQFAIGTASLSLLASAWLLAGHGANADAARASVHRGAATVAAGLADGQQTLAAAAVQIRRHIPFLLQPLEESETLTVVSTPADAVIEIDGRARGRTPATVAVAPGERRIRLKRDGYGEASGQIRVVRGQPATFAAELWRRVPVVQRLRPSYPGASIETASFLADGSVAVILALSPDGERQVWIAASPPEPAEGAPPGAASSAGRAGVGDQLPSRIGPDSLGAAVAVAPHTRQVVYLKQATPTASVGQLDAAGWTGVGVGSGPTEVWTAAADGSGAARRYVLPATSGTPGAVGRERLVDVTWAPDEAHILVAGRGAAAGGGGNGARTRLRWIDLSHAATNADVTAEARDLVVLPADLVPASYRWSPAGDRVAFLTRAVQITSLCTLEVATGQFRYLADVAQGGSGPSLAPLAWSPDGAQVAYTALVPERPSSSPFRWLTGSKTPVDLFASGAGTGGASETVRRLGAALGDANALGQWPGWRHDGSLVLLARPTSNGPLVVRTTDPQRRPGGPQDLAVLTELPSGVAGYAATWDVAHAQALLAVRSTTNSGIGRLDYWLVRFGAAPAQPVESDR